ncbi:MAG: KAP family NTPase [Campylobacteraceae bacterium]|nr:KAP family NTPase [Campylobacteraceae bacterium]
MRKFIFITFKHLFHKTKTRNSSAKNVENLFKKAIDSPILKNEDDILGFKNISDKITDGIKAFPNGEKTFTISIKGEWGSGKTSLANLIESKIKNDVIIVHFNPWMVDGFEQLTKYFFSELMIEIARNNFDSKLKKRY